MGSKEVSEPAQAMRRNCVIVTDKLNASSFQSSDFACRRSTSLRLRSGNGLGSDRPLDGEALNFDLSASIDCEQGFDRAGVESLAREERLRR